MRWGNWELIVDQHPPILRNSYWSTDIAIVDNSHSFIAWILKARSCDLAGLNADTLGLIDAISSIVAHSCAMGEEATYPLGAYSYAASCRATDIEIPWS